MRGNNIFAFRLIVNIKYELSLIWPLTLMSVLNPNHIWVKYSLVIFEVGGGGI